MEKKFKSYQESIIECTGCKPEEVNEVEEIMREDIVHSTLDWLSEKQFNKAAKEAYELYKVLKSPEGQAYMNDLANNY